VIAVLESAGMAFPAAEDAVGRVGEPDGPVGLHDDIIGGVEPAAVPVADQRRRFVAAVDLDPAVAVRALDDLALQACGASVGELDTFAVDADQAGGSTPLQDAVAGNVAVAQSRLLREPDGALRPFGQYRAITQEFQFATGQQAGLVNETHVFLTFVRPGTAVCR